MFFNSPVALKANHWYMVKVCITGPSSDAGGDGKESVTGTDGVKFLFKESKTSNNGTTVKSGQLPGIIYRLSSDDGDKEVAEVSEEKKDGSVVHMIKKDFAGTVSEVCAHVRVCMCARVCAYVCVHMCVTVSMLSGQVGIQAVLKLLDWSWHLFSDSGLVGGSGIDNTDITFIATTCINLLRIYITYAYPIQGKTMISLYFSAYSKSVSNFTVPNCLNISFHMLSLNT